MLEPIDQVGDRRARDAELVAVAADRNFALPGQDAHGAQVCQGGAVSGRKLALDGLGQSHGPQVRAQHSAPGWFQGYVSTPISWIVRELGAS